MLYLPSGADIAFLFIDTIHMKTLLTSLLFCGSFLTMQAENIHLSQSNKSGLYQSGDTLRVFLHGGDSSPIRRIRVYTDYGPATESQVEIGPDSTLVFEQPLKEHHSYIISAFDGGDSCSLGAISDYAHIEPGFKRPNDLNQFWNSLKEKVRNNTAETERISQRHVPTGYVCEEVVIPTPEGIPARGYVAYPDESRPHSLPIVINFHAAGVKGDWCKSKPEIALEYAKKGALCLDINAHGMLNGQPDSYYEALEAGALNAYFYQGITNRDSIYFRDMYIRLMSAIEYLTRDSLWDRKRLLVIGESQGGGQALAAAGLDNRVSDVVAIVPAMCDWGAEQVGRRSGWPQPLNIPGDEAAKEKTLPYFDVAHLLKDSKATFWVEIGLIDRVCPSSSIFAALNQAQGKKYLYTVPYRAHHQEQPFYQKEWEKEIYSARQGFIEAFLKGDL